MERIWRQTVTEERQLGDYLSQVLHLSKHQISQAKFRENGICVNGKQQRVTYGLHIGDLLEVKLEEEKTASRQFLPEGRSTQVSSEVSSSVNTPLQILWEDEDLLAVNKPAGLVIHPSHGHYQDTLANQVMAYASSHGESLRIRAIGRLDKETSGIVLFAKNQLAAARLSAQREKGILSKTYLAIATGHVEPASGILSDPIEKQSGSLMKMQAGREGKSAVTHYQVIGYGVDYSVLQIKIETGRTHQIRVHFLTLGHPLLGDSLYGSPDERIGRTALHAWRLEFNHPIREERISLEAPVPEDFQIFPMIHRKFKKNQLWSG